MKKDPVLTAAKAVLCGHLVVTLPALAITGLGALIASVLVGPPPESSDPTALSWHQVERLPVGAFLGCLVGWIWWSASVPRWREWARANGADVQTTQRLAERTLLVWPKGWLLEKAEFRIRKGN